ncbi:MAG TPA: tRNA pseudouridine(55) synthase TruB [Candidatus Elarobacter sp.]|nr:tRNA pseudouridine(55) synthase TruB [Candidatus Elarobacter sp.]
MTGVLLVDKPEGMTSAGVIRALKPRLGRIKVGHLGTLDPFASGLLPLCLGEATKVARYLLVEHKAYEGTIRLGTATDTLDRTGTPIDTAPVPAVAQAALDAVAARFTGRQQQVPPMYSALKRDGVPLYELARRGLEVERAPREVTIERLELVLRAADRIDFRVACSKGTYVRVLAADVGRALETRAHLERLRRTRVGAFRVEDATAVDALLALAPAAALPVLAVREALAGYPAVAAPPDALERLRRGQQAPLARLPAPRAAGETALLLDPAGDVAAIIEAAGARPAWRLVRLLRSRDTVS